MYFLEVFVFILEIWDLHFAFLSHCFEIVYLDLEGFNVLKEHVRLIHFFFALLFKLLQLLRLVVFLNSYFLQLFLLLQMNMLQFLYMSIWFDVKTRSLEIYLRQILDQKLVLMLKLLQDLNVTLDLGVSDFQLQLLLSQRIVVQKLFVTLYAYLPSAILVAWKWPSLIKAIAAVRFYAKLTELQLLKWLGWGAASCALESTHLYCLLDYFGFLVIGWWLSFLL